MKYLDSKAAHLVSRMLLATDYCIINIRHHLEN